MKFFIVMSAGVFFASFALASEPVENPCAPILLACQDQGYVDDPIADPGMKIWADCANPIINQNQKVRGIDIEPGRLVLCRNYKKTHGSLQ